MKLLKRLLIEQDCQQTYKYYQVSHPWLIISCLKIMNSYPNTSSIQIKQDIQSISNNILQQDHSTTQRNQNNIYAAVFFETINLIIKYKKSVSL